MRPLGHPPCRLLARATSNARRFKSAALEFGWKNSGDKEREEKGKERGAMLQSPIPSFRSCALVRSLLFAKVPRRRRTERDNRPEIWFSPLSSLLSVPVTEDNDPKSAAAPRRLRLVVNSKDFRARFSSPLSKLRTCTGWMSVILHCTRRCYSNAHFGLRSCWTTPWRDR